MGVDQKFLIYLDERGVLNPGTSILDIGTQNLYLASVDGLRKFLSRHGKEAVEHYSAFIQKMCTGGEQVGNGFRNDAFLSELIAQTKMRYTAFDIFPGPATTVFDLNVDTLPRAHRNAHDVVLNFGTTEHVVNQYNALQVIHNATKPGGWMFHQVPSTGCVDHGYFVYSPKFFKEIAAANGYEIADLWFSGPWPQGNIFATIHYQLELFRNESRPGNNLSALDRNTVYDSCINVLLRKIRDEPFRLPLETSTSVSRVSRSIERRYALAKQPSAFYLAALEFVERHPQLRMVLRTIRNRLRQVRDNKAG